MKNFNNKLALRITNLVSSMYCAYFFCLIALISLPATLTLAKVVSPDFFPAWAVSAGLIALVAWVAQTFIQLVLLSVIMVGQKVQADQTVGQVKLHVDKNHAEHMSLLTKVHGKVK